MLDLSNGRLSWLRAAPESFRATLRSLSKDDSPIPGAVLVDLAKRDLDLNQLLALDKLLVSASARIDTAGTAPLRLAVLAAGSMDYTIPAIRATALRHGFLLQTYCPDFGQATAEVMSPASGLQDFKPQAALIAPTADSLGLIGQTMDAAAATASVANAVADITAQVGRLQAMGVGMVIVQTVPYPANAWTGNLDRNAPGSSFAQIAAFNAAIAQLATERSLILLDCNALASQVGSGRWFDAAIWQRAKVPMALDIIPLYADHVTRLLWAASGKACKCLVLDLDNTCWGGVIGDDGLEGIRIGQGSAEGEAFLAIQNYALSLKARGVVLAVCSKNEDSNARLPFEKHPDMALRLTDIAVFVANWTDKATNISAIAKTLNIGTDALAFLDDNPAERERVRQILPEVSVPEVGDDPTHYPAYLAHGGYFETIALTADDAKRADQYRANSLRLAEMAEVGDYDTYLASLDMHCQMAPFDAVGRARIAQLINKSNQFNLTTRRYTEAEVADIEADEACFTLQVRLTDRFGDNGMISVVIFRKEGTDWICDTWLMSCRVLKRRVEEAVLSVVTDAARKAGAKRLIGEYIPSPKNSIVADHFKDLGFAEDSASADGVTRWVMNLSDYSPPKLPMKIDRDASI
ncbi:MAG: HAD-IIIC family phosphatase [Paracoccaceae bacterium]|nr:HAD-IIIC family phosphatase [Paracoccaceae bacterium]